ncbi:MAG TPA: TonB family protein [Gammaproteobacteria bacterium]
MASATEQFDRLSSMLFFAALAHGVVILGVTFAPSPPAEPNQMPSLNVTLLVETDTLDADARDAEMLASRSQQGGGNDDSLRATRTLTAQHPRNQDGDPLGPDEIDADALAADTPVDRLVSRSPSSRQVEAVPETTDQPGPQPMTAAALLNQAAPATLAAELDLEAASASRDEAEINAPSTRESALAAYMVGWRQRVERVGTANFPREFLRGAAPTARPIVEVTIDAAGRLEETVLRRSSGDANLDRAVLEILELAGPFAPLPDVILADYDVLRFAYEWDFSTTGRATSQVR